MRRDEIIQKLREREADLKVRGVAHAALFGSIARNQQRSDSDIDIMVDLDPDISDGMTVYDYVNLKSYIASLFEGRVDVVDREALKPRLRSRAALDAIYAF